MASSSSSRPSSRASFSACAADCAIGWPSSSLKAATSRASSASRSARLDGGRQGERAAVARSHLATRFRRDRPAAPAAAAGSACRRTRAGRPRATPAPSAASAPGSAHRPAPADRRHARRARPRASSSAKRRSMPMVNTPFIASTRSASARACGRADMEPLAVMDERRYSRPAASARFHSFSSENGPRASRRTDARRRPTRWRRNRAQRSAVPRWRARPSGSRK